MTSSVTFDVAQFAPPVVQKTDGYQGAAGTDGQEANGNCEFHAAAARGLRRQIEAAAKKEDRSLNEEIVHRLEDTFRRDTADKILDNAQRLLDRAERMIQQSDAEIENALRPKGMKK